MILVFHSKQPCLLSRLYIVRAIGPPHILYINVGQRLPLHPMHSLLCQSGCAEQRESSSMLRRREKITRLTVSHGQCQEVPQRSAPSHFKALLSALSNSSTLSQCTVIRPASRTISHWPLQTTEERGRGRDTCAQTCRNLQWAHKLRHGWLVSVYGRMC